MAQRLERLERDEPARLTLLHGSETYLVERALEICRRRAGEGAAWRVVWGDDEVERVRDGLDALASAGLFGGAANVVLRRAEAMRGPVEAAVEGVLEEDRYEGRLVLVAAALDRRKRWCQAAARRAVEVECAPPADVREIRGWVERMARAREATIAGDAAAELVERCGSDLSMLDGEVEKLALVAPARRIDRALVAGAVASVRAHGVEELADRLARGDVAGVVRTLRGLLDAGEPALRILAFLAANLRRTLHVVEQQEAGLRADDVAARLGMPDWLVRRHLGRGPARRLERALATLAELDLALKRSRPEAVVMEAALGELARASAR